MADAWVVPASYAQERIWFACQIARDAPVYHVLDRIRLPYPVPYQTVAGALTTIVERHETLRTSFRLENGAVMQVVHPEIALPVERVELGDADDEVFDQAVESALDAIASRPLPLERAPLWRATLLHREGRDWSVVFAAHHAVVDAASELNLHAELTEICAAAAAARPARLPELPIQYADYAVWQRDRLTGGALAEQLAFWRTALHDLPAVHGLPTDRPRPGERTFGGADLIFALPSQVNTDLPDLVRRTTATPFMVLLAGYAALLHRLSSRDDIVVGVPMTGRDRPELQPLIGMFVNMVVLRLDVSGDPTFADLVERVRTTALAAWDHQEMPYQKLVESLAVRRDPGVPPLYQLGFNYLTTGFTRSSDTAEDDLMLEVGLSQGRIEYNTALFDASTVMEIAEAYVALLATALRQPETRVSQLVSAPTRTATAGPPPATAPPAAHVAPRTPAEALVAEVWADVLGVARVGAQDEFFALGGHSLLALRVIARIAAAAEIELPLQSFFADTTVAGVAAAVEQALAAELDELSEEEAQRLVAEERRTTP